LVHHSQIRGASVGPGYDVSHSGQLHQRGNRDPARDGMVWSRPRTNHPLSDPPAHPYRFHPHGPSASQREGETAQPRKEWTLMGQYGRRLIYVVTSGL